MLDSLRKQTRTLPDYLNGRVSTDSAIVRRVAWSAIAGLSVFVLLLLVIEGRVLSALPDYPAASLVLLSIIVLPGLFLHQALLRGSRVDAIERLAMAFPLGIAIAAPSALLALFLNLSLDMWLRLDLVTASLVVAGSAFCSAPPRQVSLFRAVRGWSKAPDLLLLILAAVGVAGVVTSPFWADDRLARNFDDWRYMTYVNSYLQSDQIEPLHPIGIGEAPYPRMAVNVWVVLQAGVAHAAGVSAEGVVIDDLAPLLIVFAIAATYTMAKGLFRSRTIALAAVILELGYALTDMAHDEGLGANLLFRMSEDKMVATYILFPLALLFASRLFRNAQPASFATFALICLALFVVHPQPLMFLGVATGALALVRSGSTRSWRPIVTFAVLAVPLAAFSFGEMAVWHLFNTSWPALFETTLTWRESYKIVHLPGNMIMGNYHLLLHPLTLGALVIASLAWCRRPRSLALQTMLAATAGWLPLFFVPPLTTLTAKFASAELTSRLPVMAPVAIVWAYAIYQTVRFFGGKLRGSLRDTALAAGPAVLAVIMLGSALIVQELYYRADGGAYYTWANASTIVPGTERSIFLGGKDRLLSREWRLSPEKREMLEYIEAHSEPGAVVLAPNDVSLYMPGVARRVRPAFSQAIIGQWQQPAAMGVYQGGLRGPELQSALDQASVRYVVVREVSDANEAMAELPTAQQLAEFGAFQIYEVDSVTTS